MNIEIIKNIISSENLILTDHFFRRLRERNIKINDVIEAIQNGEIIEHYPNDYPYPSCLILGFYDINNALHIVCGFSTIDNKLWLITVYKPSIEKWNNDFKTRK